MTFIVEISLRQARVGHQELEAGVNRVVKLLAHQTKTHKQKLMQQHKVLKEVLTMQKSAKVKSIILWRFGNFLKVRLECETESMEVL